MGTERPLPHRHYVCVAEGACVDFSAGKGGLLAAYRWDGEQTLTADKFVAVSAS